MPYWICCRMILCCWSEGDKALVQTNCCAGQNAAKFTPNGSTAETGEFAHHAMLKKCCTIIYTADEPTIVGCPAGFSAAAPLPQ